MFSFFFVFYVPFFSQSFIELSALTVSAAACGWSFYHIDQLAGWIFVPYVAWLGFATFLNYTIFKLNQSDKSIQKGDKNL